MNELKKTIGGLSSQMAAIINAAFAVIFILFVFILPAASYFGYGVSLTKLAFNGSFFSVLYIIFLLLGALAAGAWPLLKKTVCPCITGTVAVWYVAGAFLDATPAIGFGSIINIIIVVAPWVLFTICRKDTVVDFGININVTTDNTNNGPKLPGQK